MQQCINPAVQQRSSEPRGKGQRQGEQCGEVSVFFGIQTHTHPRTNFQAEFLPTSRRVPTPSQRSRRNLARANVFFVVCVCPLRHALDKNLPGKTSKGVAYLACFTVRVSKATKTTTTASAVTYPSKKSVIIMLRVCRLI